MIAIMQGMLKLFRVSRVWGCYRHNCPSRSGVARQFWVAGLLWSGAAADNKLV